MEKILVIDNYDSFTYNLVHLIEELTSREVPVRRNDKITLDEIDVYDTLILSPGPGIPDEAGLLKDIIKTYAPTKKILGVCLGLQAIGEVFGATLKNLDHVFHGVKTEMIQTENKSILFEGLEGTFEAGRYHSWVIEKSSLPSSLSVTCEDATGEIMGIQHNLYNVHAVQFHPESILTPQGDVMLSNFLFKCKS